MSHRQTTAARRKREQLVGLVCRAEHDVGELAGVLGLRLEQLAAMAGDRQVIEAVNGLRLLAEMQGRLLISRCRATAAARLMELAGQQEDGELARKASVDLLKLEALREPAGGEGPGRPAEPSLDEGKLLAVLERMNRED